MTYEQFSDLKIKALNTENNPAPGEVFGETGFIRGMRRFGYWGSIISLSLLVSCSWPDSSVTSEQVKAFGKCNDPREATITVKTRQEPIQINKELNRIEILTEIPGYDDANYPDGREILQYGTNKRVKIVKRGFPPSGNSGSIRYIVCGENPSDTTYVNAEHLQINEES